MLTCIKRATLLVLVTTISLAASIEANAQLMTVEQLRQQLESGKAGELAATAYVQGVVDGLMAMETMHRKGLIREREFCKLKEAHVAGRPLPHPAFRTREIVLGWERTGRPADTIAVDVVLSFLSGAYGCK